MCINRVWGSVCSSTSSYRWYRYWDVSDSKVVCSQLGYQRLGTKHNVIIDIDYYSFNGICTCVVTYVGGSKRMRKQHITYCTVAHVSSLILHACIMSLIMHALALYIINYTAINSLTSKETVAAMGTYSNW